MRWYFKIILWSFVAIQPILLDFLLKNLKNHGKLDTHTKHSMCDIIYILIDTIRPAQSESGSARLTFSSAQEKVTKSNIEHQNIKFNQLQTTFCLVFPIEKLKINRISFQKLSNRICHSLVLNFVKSNKKKMRNDK